MNGLLLIDKPSGWTSFDVVAKIRGTLKHGGVAKPKVGHTGTLDPLATGLLVLVLGDYCKRAQEFSKLDKVYDVTMLLGQTSTTGDEEGDKTLVNDMQPSETQLRDAAAKFRGEIEQVPPAYSAIKINGQRAYKLARAGKEVKLESRKVTVYSLDITDYSYPEATFITSVSSGTYVRTLAEDIGYALGTGAYMSALRRLSVGQWKVDNAFDMSNITPETIAQNLITL